MLSKVSDGNSFAEEMEISSGNILRKLLDFMGIAWGIIHGHMNLINFDNCKNSGVFHVMFFGIQFGVYNISGSQHRRYFRMMPRDLCQRPTLFFGGFLQG